jgi:hypothetical protein
MRSGVYRPEEVEIIDVFKSNMMIADILLEEDDRISVCGTVNVMDHSNLSLAHMTQFSPSLVKKMTTVFQVKIAEPTKTVCYPLLMELLHLFLNT